MDSLEKTMDVEDLNTHLTKININMIKIRELIINHLLDLKLIYQP
jgi:hypothetical protein